MPTRDNAEAHDNGGPLNEQPEVPRDEVPDDEAPDDEAPDDEASRESFPASDPPSSWAGEEYVEPDPPASA